MVDDLSKNILFDINSKFLIMQQDRLSNNLKKTNSNENILGFDCKKYKYKNALHSEKESKKVWIYDEWDFMHTFDGVFIKDLGLVFKLEGKFGSSTIGGVYQETVIDVIETIINDELFELPNYPIEKVDMAKVSKTFINENK